MMETYKAAFVDHLRKEFARKAGSEADFLARLTVEEQSQYRALLPLSWITPELGSRFLEAAAAVLCVDSPDPVFELARRQAHNDMNGIYRLLLRVATVSMVIERAARLFANYHRRGSAEVQSQAGERRGIFLVHDYPELTPAIRTSVGGFVTGLLELTGASAIKVRADEADPRHWRWEISWA